MKRKATTESDRFDKVMDCLLAVPYKELQQKLDEEKKAKAERKRAINKAGRSEDRPAFGPR
jgi:inner membrane protein involved in colicin E2 resistance